MPAQPTKTIQNLPPETIKLLDNVNSTLKNMINSVNEISTNLNNIVNIVSNLQPKVDNIQKTQKTLLQIYKELAKGLIPDRLRSEFRQAFNKSLLPEFIQNYIEDLKDWFKNSFTIHQVPKKILEGTNKVISFLQKTSDKIVTKIVNSKLARTMDLTISLLKKSFNEVKFGLGYGIENLRDFIQNTFNNIATSKIGRTISNTTQKIRSGLVSTSNKIQTFTTNTFNRIATSKIGKGISNVASKIGNVGIKVGASLAKTGKGILGVVGKMAKGLGGAIGFLLQIALDLLYPILLWVKAILGTMINSLAGVIKMIGAIFGIVTTIFNFLSFTIIGLLGALMINVQKLFSNIGKFFDNLWTKIKEFFKKLEEKIVGFSKNVWKGIKNIFKKNDDTNENIIKTSNETKGEIKKTENKVKGEIKSSTEKQKSEIQKTKEEIKKTKVEVQKTKAETKTKAEAIVKEEKVKAPTPITPPSIVVPKVEVSKELKPLVDTMIGQFSITNGKLDSISAKIQEMGTVITNINGALLIEKQKSTVRNYQ